MYNPVPNLRNCCKARDDGHGEEEMMAMEKDSGQLYRQRK